MSTTYRRFLKELAKISARAPTEKKPEGYNTHHLVNSPYRDFGENARDAPSQLLNNRRLRTEQYDKHNPVPPAKAVQPGQTEYLTDIPLPFNLLKHIRQPCSTFDSGSPVNRILGFKIQSKGRRGDRSVKQVYSYGKLAQTDTANSMMDFARSHFITKKGATGVKVWITYGR
ncbi:hypothetical protein HDV00_009839 [Rhizophlyctis rosea]|nr:hypothetical protein HDV00_009839 [Rhizophlyctis rosea]